MTIIRTPRPAEPDTRYPHHSGIVGRDTYDPRPSRAIGLRARARRANLVVATREAPRRPQPRQDVRVLDEAGWSLPVLAVNADTGRASLDADVPRYYDYADLRVVLSW